MSIHENLMLMQNKRVYEFAEEILRECERREFTIAEMKDLADIVPSKIDEALVLSDKKTKFNIPVI